MAVRNFWIKGLIDGRKNPITGGPVNKDGGFDLTIKVRDEGGIDDAIKVHGNVLIDDDGQRILVVRVFEGNTHRQVYETRRQR